MYPTEELKSLAARKRELRARISWHRWECASAGARLAQPLEVVDQLAAHWRQLSPLLKLSAVPLGLLFRPHRKFKWFRMFGTLLRLAPSIIRTFRAYRASTAEA
jgi:hypothetical protein